MNPYTYVRSALGSPAPQRRHDTLDALADYALDLRFDALPESTVNAARNCVLDCVTAALAGAESDGARAARAAAPAAFGAGGPCSVWFSGVKAPAAGAMLANCTAASILDLDDGNRAATGHPGAAIIPACLAMAEETGCGWEELVTCIVLGYEVAVRVAAGRDFSRLDTMSTGKWCNYGVAAAVGRMRGLSRDQMIQAMAITGVHGPNQSAAGYSKVMGNHAKEGIAWSALTGAMSVTLAQAGFTGPTDILDHPAYFDRVAILRGLGRSFAIEQTYFKPYSCCRWAHAAIDGLTDILIGEGLRREAIETVEVHTFERALKLNNDVDPATLEGAQYSVPFMLGVAAVEGRDALLPLTLGSLHNPDSVAFARKVHLMVDAEINDRFPATTGARVVLVTGTGRHMREVMHPKGDPANPMTREELVQKFTAATRHLDTAALLAPLQQFDRGDHRPLLAALALPVNP
ncbi:MmgE/PrpD family protein [Paracoccaceae bacterium Fryx2]|nr:MmgE/PrpD family protein [Paracoccaceae bacterium Fryx2]